MDWDKDILKRNNSSLANFNSQFSLLGPFFFSMTTSKLVMI